MQIGKLDSYVRIEAQAASIDPNFGSEQISWVTHKLAWARIDDITTRQQESTESNLRSLKRPCKVTMWYDDTIDVTMRIIVLDRNNRMLQIVSKPAELGRRAGMEFMAEDYNV